MMPTKKMQKRNVYWMLMAILCLLLITPFRNISTIQPADVRHAVTVSAEDSLTARIEDGKLNGLTELRHFLNATIEKNTSRTRIAHRFDEINLRFIHRSISPKHLDQLLWQAGLAHWSAWLSFSILSFLDSIRLLN